MKRIEIISTDKNFVITKTKRGFRYDIILWIIMLVTLFSPFIFFYYLKHKNIPLPYFMAFSLLYFTIFILITKKFVRKELISISKDSDNYLINNLSFKKEDVETLILSKFFGEVLVDEVGHLYLKIKDKKYIVCNSVSIADIEPIRNSLKTFFGIGSLAIQKKYLIFN